MATSFYLGSCALIKGCLAQATEVRAETEGSRPAGFQPVRSMPIPWDRRYYKQSESTGQEIILLRRTDVRGTWICIRPDNSLAKVNLLQWTTVTISPLATVTYAAAPTLAGPRRAMLEIQAAQVHAGTLVCPTLEAYRAGPRGGRPSSVESGARPGSASQTVRGRLPSKWRAAGGLVFLYMMSEALEPLGVVAMIRRLIDKSVTPYNTCHAAAGGAESAWRSGLAMLRAVWFSLEVFGEPHRIFLYALNSASSCAPWRPRGTRGTTPTTRSHRPIPRQLRPNPWRFRPVCAGRISWSRRRPPSWPNSR